MERLRRWWREAGWWGLSPYRDRDGDGVPDPPRAGPSRDDWARVVALEDALARIRVAARAEADELQRRMEGR